MTASTCRLCGSPLPEQATGRPRAWCDQACKAAASARRRRLERLLAQVDRRRLEARLRYRTAGHSDEAIDATPAVRTLDAEARRLEWAIDELLGVDLEGRRGG